MTVWFQSFNGGTPGTRIDYTSSPATGAQVYDLVDGTATVTYTSTTPIRGTTSAVATVPTGATHALVAVNTANATKVSAHVTIRVPDTLPTGGYQVMVASAPASAPTRVSILDGGVLRVGKGSVAVGLSPSGTLPKAGTLVRVALAIDTTGQTTASFFKGRDTAPFWTCTAASVSTSPITEIITGLYAVTTPPLSLTLDDFRVDNTQAVILPSDGPTGSLTWIREHVGWRQLGTPDAREERWTPPTGIGAKNPGQGGYTVPNGAIYVATTGNDATGTGAIDTPYATLTKAVNAATTGSTIVLRGGTHDCGVALPADPATINDSTLWAGLWVGKAITIMSAPGEAAWLDGSAIRTGWTKSGTVWEAPIVATFDRSPTGVRGADDNTDPDWRYVNSDRPTACWPEQVWIDGVRQTQVVDRSKVVPGTFAVEGTYDAATKLMTSSKYVIGTDPTGREVRTSKNVTALALAADGATLKGVGIRRYSGSVPSRGAVKLAASGTRIEHCTIEDPGTVGISCYQATGGVIRSCTVTGAGMLGIEGTALDDLTIEDCYVRDANSRRFNMAPESAGIKLTKQRRPILRRNTVHDSACIGIWLDESACMSTVTGNNVHWVDGTGIVVELTGGTTIVDNVITAPGSDCLAIFNVSNKVRVWNNTLARPGRLSTSGRVLAILADTRAPLKQGDVGTDKRFGWPHPDGVDALTVDVEVKNNILGPSGAKGILWNEDYSIHAGAARDWTAFGIKASNNLEIIRNTKPDWKWVLSSAGSTAPTIVWSWSDLQSRGLETGSATLASSDYGTDIAGNPTPAAKTTRPTGAALPADIATLLGAATGATNLIGANPR